eukprot:3542239-Rhodomonas_salina.3
MRGISTAKTAHIITLAPASAALFNMASSPCASPRAYLIATTATSCAAAAAVASCAKALRPPSKPRAQSERGTKTKRRGERERNAHR